MKSRLMIDLRTSCTFYTYTGLHHANEDRMIVKMDIFERKAKETPMHIYGVFDGHGGDGCSSFIKEKIISIFKESYAESKALLKAVAVTSLKLEHE